MSFVQAVDGRFYVNPILWGGGWWASFADHDDPEVVVAYHKSSSPASGKSRATKLLREAGVVAKGLEYCGQSARFFPPDMRSREAINFAFKLLAPIPVPNSHDSVVDQPGAVWDHHIHGFYSDMSAADCAKAVLGLGVHPLISRALLSTAIYTKNGGVQAELCKKLYAQVPWLREMRIDTYVEQLEGHPKIVRINWRVA